MQREHYPVSIKSLPSRAQRTQRKRRWKENGAEPHGPENLQIARDLMTGEESSVVLNLPNLRVQLANIVTELCVFAQAY